MKILVTGGLGYIGSHTCVKLLEEGNEVIIFDNLSNSSMNVLEGIHNITNQIPQFYQGDVTVLSDVLALFKKEKNIDAVIHFAAQKSVAESVIKPNLYYCQNINGLNNILFAMEKNNCDKIIFSSSATVYGNPEKVPILETAPMQIPASSPYARSKQLGELIIKDITQFSLLRSIILRYFNPVGAHHSSKIGELPQGIPNNLMPYITQVAVGIRPYLNVFGNDYNTPDGTCIRDYIHIEDLAEAHWKALDYLQNNPSVKIDTFNIGTGIGYSVLDVVKSANKSLKTPLPYKIMPRRNGDVPSYFSNSEKAAQFLNWEAKLNLDAMTLSSINWELNIKK